VLLVDETDSTDSLEIRRDGAADDFSASTML